MPGVQVLFGFLLTVPSSSASRRQRLPARRLLRHAARCDDRDGVPGRTVRVPPHAFQQQEKERIIQMGTRQFAVRARRPRGGDDRSVPARDRRALPDDDRPSSSWWPSRRSSAGSGSASAYGGDGSDERSSGDPRHRRHARRLQLPPRAGVVPRVAPARPARRRSGASTATSAWAATSSSPRCSATRWRSGRATTSAPPRRRSTWRSSTRSSRCTAPATLIEDLKRRGAPVVLASSAKPDEIEHYLDLLDARELADAWTSAGDVEETKPAPDLVEAALEKRRRRTRGDDRRLDLGLPRRPATRASRRSRCSPAASPSRSCSSRRDRRLRLDRRAAPAA